MPPLRGLRVMGSQLASEVRKRRRFHRTHHGTALGHRDREQEKSCRPLHCFKVGFTGRSRKEDRRRPLAEGPWRIICSLE